MWNTWCGNATSQPANRGKGAGVLAALLQAVVRSPKQVAEVGDEAPALRLAVLPPLLPPAGHHLSQEAHSSKPLIGSWVPPVPSPPPPLPPSAQDPRQPGGPCEGGQGEGAGPWGEDWGATISHWGKEEAPGGKGGPRLMGPGNSEHTGEEEEEVGDHYGPLFPWPLTWFPSTCCTGSHAACGIYRDTGARRHGSTPLSPGQRRVAGCYAPARLQCGNPPQYNRAVEQWWLKLVRREVGQAAASDPTFNRDRRQSFTSASTFS